MLNDRFKFRDQPVLFVVWVTRHSPNPQYIRRWGDLGFGIQSPGGNLASLILFKHHKPLHPAALSPRSLRPPRSACRSGAQLRGGFWIFLREGGGGGSVALSSEGFTLSQNLKPGPHSESFCQVLFNGKPAAPQGHLASFAKEFES